MHDVGQAYAALASRYIELFGHLTSVHPDDVALIERHLSPSPGPVLDVGCGPGHLTAHLSELGVDAVGLDLAAEFIEHAHATHPLDRFVLGALGQVPIRDAAASGILAWYSLIHLPPGDIDPVLAELRRTARPGARLVAGFFDADELAAVQHQVTTAYVWPVDELADRLACAGFVEIDRTGRAADPETRTRSHAAIVAVAS